MPGEAGPAAQTAGWSANATTLIRQLSAVKNAGARAAARSAPAPAWAMPTSSRRRASSSPVIPKSAAWLLASEAKSTSATRSVSITRGLASKVERLVAAVAPPFGVVGQGALQVDEETISAPHGGQHIAPRAEPCSAIIWLTTRPSITSPARANVRLGASAARSLVATRFRLVGTLWGVARQPTAAGSSLPPRPSIRLRSESSAASRLCSIGSGSSAAPR